jgi:V8-like Glu-specific endopeptidase
MDYFPAIFGLLVTVLMIYIIFQLKRITEELRRTTEEQKRTTEEQKRTTEELMQLKDNSPMVITDAMFEKLHGATFAILDDDGHPVCCGFFVTPCGVALTAAHSCDYARPGPRGASLMFRASTYRDQEFTLDIVSHKVGALDIAILRVSNSCMIPRDFLPLPSVRHSHLQLLGAPVALIHGSIAWSAGSEVHQIARDNGTIITSSDTLLHYSVSSYKGYSGAALLFRSGQVIGLHSEGFNDLEQEQSEKSPSTSADAVRLDVPQIWDAVQAAKGVSSATSTTSGGIRRR